MYIHIGANYIINENDVVGLFDIETTTTSQITRDYLASAQRGGRIINISSEIPKTYVVCINKPPKNLADYRKNKKNRRETKITVYLSQYSAATIRGRRKVNQFTEG